MSNNKVLTLPVIERELRTQSRKRGVYYVRFLLGLGGFAALAYVFWTEPRVAGRGDEMFMLIHRFLVFALLLFAPLLTADSISRERREGTLGLLLLTPLTVWQLVLGKFFSHFLRLFYLWLLALPFLMLPVLIGGVGLELFLVSIAILLAVLMIGLSAGMVASAMSLQFGRALFRAFFFSILATYLCVSTLAGGPFIFLSSARTMEIPSLLLVSVAGPFFVLSPMDLVDAYQYYFPGIPMLSSVAFGMAFSGILFLLFALKFCAWKIARHGRIEVESKRQEALRRRFLTPLFRRRYRRWTARKLDRNPFVWLEYRSASARAARSAAILFTVCGGTYLVTLGPYAPFFSSIFGALWVLLATITLKSLSSFQQEKETGAFELILTTTIGETALVHGRIQAVYRYFMLFGVILALFTIPGAYMEYRISQKVNWAAIVSFPMSVFSIPAAALFFSLRFKSFFTALAWTSTLAILLPPVLWRFFQTSFTAARESQWIPLSLEYILDFSAWPWIAATLFYHVWLTRFFSRKTIDLLTRRAF